MKYIRLSAENIDELVRLHLLYKADIGEEAPSDEQITRLAGAVADGRIAFYGACCDGHLVGICSVCVIYSTFDYAPSGVFEDFYILPEHRHRGIARALANFAYMDSGVSTMLVGCAECDAEMYRAIGFDVQLGSMLAMTK